MKLIVALILIALVIVFIEYVVAIVLGLIMLKLIDVLAGKRN